MWCVNFFKPTFFDNCFLFFFFFFLVLFLFQKGKLLDNLWIIFLYSFLTHYLLRGLRNPAVGTEPADL